MAKFSRVRHIPRRLPTGQLGDRKRMECYQVGQGKELEHESTTSGALLLVAFFTPDML